jgi:hypothetical protein
MASILLAIYSICFITYSSSYAKKLMPKNIFFALAVRKPARQKYPR